VNTLRLYYFFVFAMYAVIVPQFQLFLAALGYSPREVGLLLGFFEIFGVAGPIVFGAIADRTGRFRELKIAGTMSAGVAFAVLLLDMPLLPALFVSGIAGFLFKTSVPLTDAVAGTVLQDPQDQYGKVRVMGSIGFGVTSLAIPLLGIINPDSAPSMLIAFLVSLIVFSTVVLVVPPPVPQSAPAPVLAYHETPAAPDAAVPAVPADPADTASPTTAAPPSIPRSVWAVIGVVAVGNVAFGAYNSFFSLYLRNTLAVEAVTVYWAIGALSEIPIIFFSGRLIRRFGTGPLMTAAGIAMALRLVAYALKPALPVVAVIQLLHALTFGLMLSAGIAYVNTVAPPARRATALTAFNALGMGLAVFTGSVIGGYLIEAVGFTAMFGILSVFPAAGAVLMFRLTRRDPYLRR